MNEIDMSASEINDIERELKVEISSDAVMQILCDERSEISEDNVKLKKHMKDHHEQHICNVCGYIDYGRKKFNEHNRKHNQASCHICQKLKPIRLI